MSKLNEVVDAAAAASGEARIIHVAQLHICISNALLFGLPRRMRDRQCFIACREGDLYLLVTNL